MGGEASGFREACDCCERALRLGREDNPVCRVPYYCDDQINQCCLMMVHCGPCYNRPSNVSI